MTSEGLKSLLSEIETHLAEELLPFWLQRCRDKKNGGYVTHFDSGGKDTGEDEKSLISQTRSLYTMASLCRSKYADHRTLAYAEHGLDFLIDKMWDDKHGGFYWMVDRKGNTLLDNKILYGQIFAIYALSEYTLASGNSIGREYAEKTFDLIQKYCVDTLYGGYLEMFGRGWQLAGPGSQGGDRKTLDVHMHLMEALTTLYECSGETIHRRRAIEVIEILRRYMLHPKYGTGIPQFTIDWHVAPQIKFDIVWGWDRFEDAGQKSHANDNTSYGHNAELAWLLNHAVQVLDLSGSHFNNSIQQLLSHCLRHGIDHEFGGVFVEGPHKGGVYDMQKEFWQQAEVLTAMLDGYMLFNDTEYLEAYRNVHRFVMDKVVNHSIGEWWPLLTREGKPIWTHMSHSWKINYHTVRSMIQSAQRLSQIIEDY
jgi:mannobiose 2-epimerase